MEADITSQAVGLASNTDFSLLSLFLRADFVVKTVIIMLIVCSIYSWAIIIEKFKLFKKINLESEEFEEKFWRARSAETFYNSLPVSVENPMASMFKDSMQTLLKTKSKSNLNENHNGMAKNITGQQLLNIIYPINSNGQPNAMTAMYTHMQPYCYNRYSYIQPYTAI